MRPPTLTRAPSSDRQKFIFNLATDPNETTDLAADEPERIASLKKKLETIRAGE